MKTNKKPIERNIAEQKHAILAVHDFGSAAGFPVTVFTIYFQQSRHVDIAVVGIHIMSLFTIQQTLLLNAIDSESRHFTK